MRYCERCDLPAAMCAHGRELAAGGPARYNWAALWDMAASDEPGPWLEARYGGICRGCGGRWEPGGLIRWYPDEQGYLGECCGS